MRYARTFTIASSIVMAIALSACSGGGSEIASNPPPPQNPTPTPTPMPTAGPTIQAHSDTVFQLLESVVSTQSGQVTAAKTVKAGDTLEFAAPGGSFKLDIADPALGVSNVALSPTSSAAYRADLGGGHTVSLLIADPASSDLSWTTYGVWDVALANGARTQAAFVTGYETPVTGMPLGGYGAYYGRVSGEVVVPQAGGPDGVNTLALAGYVELSVDFSIGRIDGVLSNMTAGTQPWNDVSLTAGISGGTFAGTTAAKTAPGNSASLSGSATGTVTGAFFGPTGQEIGAVWGLSDGTGTAIGTIGAKYDKWGY